MTEFLLVFAWRALAECAKRTKHRLRREEFVHYKALSLSVCSILTEVSLRISQPSGGSPSSRGVGASAGGSLDRASRAGVGHCVTQSGAWRGMAGPRWAPQGAVRQGGGVENSVAVRRGGRGNVPVSSSSMSLQFLAARSRVAVSAAYLRRRGVHGGEGSPVTHSQYSLSTSFTVAQFLSESAVFSCSNRDSNLPAFKFWSRLHNNRISLR